MGHVVVEIITVVLWIYWILLMFRLVMSWVFTFARSYDPHGVMLVAVESAYTATDPPLKFLRRYIRPLRIGGMALDLAFLLLVIILFLAIQFVGTI